MKRWSIPTFLAVFACGILVGVFVPAFSHPAGSKVTNLFTTELDKEFTPGRQVLVDLVEIQPNQKLDWHWHPGEEFHYYLEGDPIIERRGQAPVVPQLGTVGHVKFKDFHQASAGDRGAKILVFRVHTTGEPWRYLDESQEPQSK